MRDDAFARLYSEHARPLFAFLAYRTGDSALAEDLLADTFERALRSRWRFDRRRGTEKAWLYTIALNLLRDDARRQAAQRRALARLERLEPSPVGAEPGWAVEDRDELVAALDALAEPERDALALRYGADLTVREVAEVLGEKVPAVESRLHRALAKLRDTLA